MSIDLKLASIAPLRRTFDHIAARLGPDQSPSRYQEAVWGLQPELNFHYRPTWDPTRALYDPARSRIVMADYDDLVDPRQYYYGTWTVQRGRQQDAQERNFELVEKRGLLDHLDDAWRGHIERIVLPLRHVAWAANNNNCAIAAYGYGAPLTAACSLHMMDHLGIAQYISRIGLLLAGNGTSALDAARAAWIGDQNWQPLRALVETSMVQRDWGELFVLQNLVIDGCLHPLFFDRFAQTLATNGGAVFSMLTEFMVDWHVESARWVDAVIARVAAESAYNRMLLETWITTWLPQVRGALEPLAAQAFDERAVAVLDDVVVELVKRTVKCGLTV